MKANIHLRHKIIIQKTPPLVDNEYVTPRYLNILGLNRMLLISGLVCLFFFASCGPGLGPGNEVDEIAPVVGAFTNSTNVDFTGFTLHWSRASDNHSIASSLEYFVCTANSPAAISTVEGCLSATVALNWVSDTLSLDVTGKTHSTTYYYNVVVRDAARNMAIYNGISQVTLNAFISSWKTDNAGTSANNQITLPLEASGNYNFTVDWGDGNSLTLTDWNDAGKTHTYPAPGTYTVTITGTLTGFRFNNGADRRKLLNISQWGPLRLGNSSGYFFGASNLTITATDVLDLTGTTDLGNAFTNCTSLTTVPSMNEWNTSAVTTMRLLFAGATVFNQNIGSWNTAAVTDMSYLFDGTAFNQDIGDWNTANVTDMSYMFNSTASFNQDIGNWNTANVTDMNHMFSNNAAFNQNIGNWNTAKVTNMNAMFSAASAFNQNIGSWNTAAVTNMSSLFSSATAFNQNIGNWNTAHVTNMDAMFSSAVAFNKDIGNWDTSAVTSMFAMFANATAFSQNLGGWDVSNVTEMSFMFSSAGLIQAHYDSLLIGWSLLTLQNGVSFDGGTSQYSVGAATTARANITTNFNWTITDGGQN